MPSLAAYPILKWRTRRLKIAQTIFATDSTCKCRDTALKTAT